MAKHVEQQRGGDKGGGGDDGVVGTQLPEGVCESVSSSLCIMKSF